MTDISAEQQVANPPATAGCDRNSPWTLQMLGGFRLDCGNRIIDRFVTRYVAALLAYLAYYSGCDHSREKLIEMLWPECEESVGRNRLNYTLSTLRLQLDSQDIPRGAILVTSRFAVKVDPQYLTTDVREFENLLDRAEAGLSPDEQCRLRMQAVERYRGDLLPGRNHEWIFLEQSRLSERYLHALIQVAFHLEQAQDSDRALEYALLARQADPTSEEPYAIIIRIHISRRRYAEAIREYQQLEEKLQSDFNFPPSATLQALLDAIPEETISRIRSTPTEPSQKKGPRNPKASPALFYPPGPPKPTTSFHGRAVEMAQVLKRITAKTSPVTLTGAGGCGKTRLAIEVSEQARSEHGYTPCFVDLSDALVSSPAQFHALLADRLLLKRTTNIDPLAQVIDFLQRFPTLLVLDNFETCIDAATEAVRTIVRTMPNIPVLITSRQVLNLPGEQEIVVDPLALPAPHDSMPQQVASDSVQLFGDRARAVNSHFEWTDLNLPIIADLCRRLDGLPLAIELAAAQVRVQSPKQILAQLQLSLDAFGAHENKGSERHQTLRATIDWSFHRLPPELQRRFVLLSVFRDGWTAEAAAAVWEDANPFPSLHALREHSMVKVYHQGKTVRFQMLETLREYAAALLTPAEREAAELHFARYMVHWAQANATAFELIDREQQNLLQTLLWLQNHAHFEEALRLAIALKYFWLASRNAQYGQWWIEILLAAAGELPSAVGPEITAEAALCGRLLRLPQEDGIHWQISLAIGNSTEHEAASNRLLWKTSLVERGAALEAIQNQFALVESLANPEKLAFALYSYGHILVHMGDSLQGQEKMEQSLRLYRQRHHRFGVQMVLGGLGRFIIDKGNFPLAVLLLTEKLEMARHGGFLPEVIHTLRILGRACHSAGDPLQAERYIEESLTLCRHLGDQGRLIALLKPLGTDAFVQGDYATARVLLGERLVLCQKVGSIPLQLHTLRALAEVAYGQADFVEALNMSRRRLELSRCGDETAEEASSAADVALVHIGQAEYKQAVHYLGVSLDLFGDELRCHYALEVCARLALATAEPALAVRLFATAARLRMERLVEIPFLLFLGRDPLLEKLRSELTADSFAMLWKEGYAAPHSNAIQEAHRLLSTLL